VDLEVWFWFSKFGFVDMELRCGGYGGFGGGSPAEQWVDSDDNIRQWCCL
jgi:hypothetical protein